MKYVAPSFLSADIWQVSQQITALEEAGCQYLHLDIMDGHFVPNISYGPDWVKKLRSRSQMTFDAHLMVEEPDFLLPAFAEAGCQICTVHVEAVKHLDRTLNLIRDLGMKAGVALNPATSLGAVEEVLPLCDLVLAMSVNPGFGGQKYIPYVTSKLERLREMRKQWELSFQIEVDGGVTAENAEEITAAGADILVAGSAVFCQPDVKEAFLQLKEAVKRGENAAPSGGMFLSFADDFMPPMMDFPF